MKTILRTGNNVSLYVFDDAEVLVRTETTTTVGNPATLIIADCGELDSVVVTDVTPPADWASWKYFYTDGQWVRNPDWIDPQGT